MKTPAEMIAALAVLLSSSDCSHRGDYRGWCHDCVLAQVTALLDELLAPLASFEYSDESGGDRDDKWWTIKREADYCLKNLRDYARTRAGESK